MNSSNRRGFFKVFGVLAAAASLSPTIFIPKFEPVKWKSIPKYWEINTDWETAEYVVDFIGLSGKWEFKTIVGDRHALSAFPDSFQWKRFKNVDGTYLEIPSSFMLRQL